MERKITWDAFVGAGREELCGSRAKAYDVL